MRRWRFFVAWAAVGVATTHAPTPAGAQDLEPRAFSPAPTGLNIVALGYAYSFGNVLLDPALPITDGEARLNTLIGAYVRTIDVFGSSAKIDILLPWAAYGKWKGLVEGVQDSTTRTGFGDLALRLSVNFVGAPAIGIVYDLFPPREPEKDLPPGLRQHVFNFIFDVAADVSDGDTFSVSFLGGSFTCRPPAGRPAFSQKPDFYLSGEIRFGSGGPEPVENLEAEVSPHKSAAEGSGGSVDSGNDVLLSWRNAGAYEKIRIERNGANLAEVGGDETTFLDTGLPGGVYAYKVSGVVGSESSFPRRTLVSTFSPQGAFLRCDANRDGKINIVDPIATLKFLFLGGAPLPCEDAADSNDDGTLTISDPVITLSYLVLGSGVIAAPGTRYPWFDPTPDRLTCQE